MESIFGEKMNGSQNGRMKFQETPRVEDSGPMSSGLLSRRSNCDTADKNSLKRKPLNESSVAMASASHSSVADMRATDSSCADVLSSLQNDPKSKARIKAKTNSDFQIVKIQNICSSPA
jgi:hypothetical protein